MRWDRPGPIHLTELCVGKLSPLPDFEIPSGMRKRPVIGRLELGPTGLPGDEQGDRRHHGGVDKALHHYPHDHYDWWRSQFPDLSSHFDRPAAVGQNLSTLGLVEHGVSIGDLFELGTALVEVSQGRLPCWRLDVWLGREGAAMAMQLSGRTGWYYRVKRPGRVDPEDGLRLVDRPHPDWSIRRALCLITEGVTDPATLAEFAALPALGASWRQMAERRLETGRVEDWAPRLSGPPELSRRRRMSPVTGADA